MSTPFNALEFKGVLFIGDPHLASKKPQRRLDSSFKGTVLDKLDQVVRIANENGLFPVIIGDLFNNEGENDLELLTKLSRILKKFATPPAYLLGNHDLKESWMTDDTSIGLLIENGRLIPISDKSLIEISCGALKVSIGGTNYGGIVPTKVTRDPTDISYRMWITHDDFDFKTAYPGAKAMHEIAGIDLVINGHMHKPAPYVKKGGTTWVCPGNITRMSIDCESQVPTVYEWNPNLIKNLADTEVGLIPHPLKYTEVVFSKIGVQVSPGDASVAVTELVAQRHNEFAELLVAETALEATKTDSADLLNDTIVDAFAELNTTEPVKGVILEVYSRMKAKLG